MVAFIAPAGYRESQVERSSDAIYQPKSIERNPMRANMLTFQSAPPVKVESSQVSTTSNVVRVPTRKYFAGVPTTGLKVLPL